MYHKTIAVQYKQTKKEFQYMNLVFELLNIIAAR